MTGMDVFAEKIRRIVVIRLSAIGDIILTLPVIEALAERFPQAEIEYVTKREYAELVRPHPSLRKIWEFDRASGFAGLRSLRQSLTATRIDLLVDLHSSLRGLYLRWLGPAAMRRGHRKLGLQRLLLKWARLNLLRQAPPVADRYFTALEDFGLDRAGRRPRLVLAPETRERAARKLFGVAIAPDEPFIAVAAGASYPTKQWPADKFVAACRELSGGRLPVVALGGGQDREVSVQIVAALAKDGIKAASLAGELAIAESAAVLERASLVLTNDSGLMHAADALDRPLVAVFGPTRRELGFYPLGPKSRVIERSDLNCRPCTLHGDRRCPRGHHRCLLELEPGEAARAGRSVLAPPAGAMDGAG